MTTLVPNARRMTCVLCGGWARWEKGMEPWTCTSCIHSPPRARTGRADAPQPRQDVEPRPRRERERDPGKLTCIDAAAQVLRTYGGGQPMSCEDMIARMAGDGLWVSPGGKTPAATLHSAIGTEIRKKGPQARFVAHGKGMFSYRQEAPTE